MIDRAHLTIEHVRSLAARGCQPHTRWVQDGTLESIRHQIGWAIDHQVLFK